MKSHYLKSRISKVLFAALFLVGVSAVAGTSVQAQWPYGQDPYRRDRDDRRDRDRDRDDRYRRNGNYGNYNQVAFNQGYQDGMYTGSNDGQRGQSYNPQRSHFYRNGHGGNGSYGRNSYQYEQAYRQGFLRGYDEGFRRNNYSRRRNGNYGRWPF